MKILDIESLRKDIPFVTEGFFSLYREKCLVAFSSQKHCSGVEMCISLNNQSDSVKVVWEGEVSKQLIDSHSDSKKTTEDAACAISLLMIREFTEFTAYKTTDTSGERVDYYLRPKGVEADDNLIFNNTAYLEVAGIREKNKHNTPKKKLNSKIRRAKSATGMFADDPVYVCVVEFSEPFSILDEVSCLLA